jgi:hypothetical protein
MHSYEIPESHRFLLQQYVTGASSRRALQLRLSLRIAWENLLDLQLYLVGLVLLVVAGLLSIAPALGFEAISQADFAFPMALGIAFSAGAIIHAATNGIGMAGAYLREEAFVRAQLAAIDHQPDISEASR